MEGPKKTVPLRKKLHISRVLSITRGYYIISFCTGSQSKMTDLHGIHGYLNPIVSFNNTSSYANLQMCGHQDVQIVVRISP